MSTNTHTESFRPEENNEALRLKIAGSDKVSVLRKGVPIVTQDVDNEIYKGIVIGTFPELEIVMIETRSGLRKFIDGHRVLRRIKKNSPEHLELVAS